MNKIKYILYGGIVLGTLFLGYVGCEMTKDVKELERNMGIIGKRAELMECIIDGKIQGKNLEEECMKKYNTTPN